MPLIDKSNLPQLPVQPAEVVPAPELGGDVEVRGLMLNEQLRYHSMAKLNNGRIDVAQLLADSVFTVIDKERVPVWSRDEWQAWGSEHVTECTHLAAVAMRLSGLLGGHAEKKPESPVDGSSSTSQDTSAGAQ